MPQDFTVGADNQQINAGKLKALQAQAKANGEVFPYDTVTVYATQAAVDSQFLSDVKTVGQEFEMHTNIADKLVKKGLMTSDAPKNATTLVPADEVITSIKAAKSKDEVDALIKGDSRKTVLAAAEAQNKTFTPAK